ncbi:MAG: hypothetical protein AB7O78_14755 [Thermoleophilia bacterium]
MHSNHHIHRDHAADITARRIAEAAAVMPARRRRRNPMAALAGLLPATARRRSAQPVQ